MTQVPVRALSSLKSLEAFWVEQATKVQLGGTRNLSTAGWNKQPKYSWVEQETKVQLGGTSDLITARWNKKPKYSWVEQATEVQLGDTSNQSTAGWKKQPKLLHDNLIEDFHDNAFVGLTSLRILQVNKNRMKKIPVALKSLPDLEELDIDDNNIEYLPDYSFAENKNLMLLQLKGNPILSVGKKAFSNLPKLRKIYLSEAHDMTEFPDLEGTSSLDGLRFDRANIRVIPPDMCHHLPLLKTLDVHSNRIDQLPNVTGCSALLNLNMGNNAITSLEGRPFRSLHELTDLTLGHNYITHIPEDAFYGLDKLLYLDLSHNKLSRIHPAAFIPLMNVEDLNLGDNHIPMLPESGLENLNKLKTYHNPELREFPRKEAFPKIKLLILSYAYHCCDFLDTGTETKNKIQLKEDVTWMHGDKPVGGVWEAFQNVSEFWETLSVNHSFVVDNIFENFGTYDTDFPDYESSFPEGSGKYLEDYKPREYAHDLVIARPPINCKPKPGPFMPCDDLFGWWSLRCGVWIVFMLALLGNGVVLFVSVTSRTKMDVPRFLICNLACADFFMGIYLGFLAIVDASTLGEFRKHAIWWQMSAGCVISGFLGVLSSELSVFTLTVITLERFYAITHAMQLNKRLSLRHSSYIMLGGWIYATLLASLPLFGISDYRTFAVCLPFEIKSLISKGYVCFIMVFNGLSFFIILSCYLLMYISIRDSQAWNSNDTRVAKRMALLVFTDLLCWAPIAILSLAAAFGKELIQLNEAKVLTIFVLPLNSCANPFLYAILTKQFKKDCVLLCRRLEDSSIARHFSRASNRHASLSWGTSRRPSGLNSLVPGEKNNGNPNSVSSGSNMYGVLNYNVDVSYGKPTKSTGLSEKQESEYEQKQTKWNKGVCEACVKCASANSQHKSNKDKKRVKKVDNKKYRYRGIGDSEVILHREFASSDNQDKLTSTLDTYVSVDFNNDDQVSSNHSKDVKYNPNMFKGDNCYCKDASGKAQIALPVVTYDDSSESVEFHDTGQKIRKNNWKHSIPCCSTESSPLDPNSCCQYDLSAPTVDKSDDTTGAYAVSPDNDSQAHVQSGVARVQCKNTGSVNPELGNKEQEHNKDQDRVSSGTASKKRHRHKKRGPGKKTCVEVNGPDLVTGLGCDLSCDNDYSRSRKKRSEDVDKNIHLRFFTQSLAEHDFIQSTVCRSNSLVELTKPQLIELYHPSSKRFSLTPGQEGYMLLSGNSRDSAYVEDDEEYEFISQMLNGYIKPTRSKPLRGPTRSDFVDEEEAVQLLGTNSPAHKVNKVPLHKVMNADDSRGSCQNLSSNRSCDKESGFNSEV
ncbi:uncharacterized protein LOC121381645 [Gigantopelta aegis]|uniref:uncharacterized protein LOC121381645 n=1 Tax=Gigantopelta aegis TaxID=1735272 RepID=UPI001B88AD8F|nr:uncharacterized protein LOC121381645 [Gigantopelta aegis]